MLKRIVLSVCAALAAAVVAQAGTYTWIGGSTTWATLASWSVNGDAAEKLPGEEDDVIIPAPESGALNITASTRFSVKSLRIGATNETAQGTVKVTFDVGVTTNVVFGDMHLLRGATLTHAANKYTSSGSGVAYEKKWTVTGRFSLAVGGDMAIDDGAFINVSGCGYKNGAGPGGKTTGTTTTGETFKDADYGAGSYGGHSHRKNNYPACYGCIRAPLDYGSGGQAQYGGGSVNLVVGKDLTVNGVIRSNANDGGNGGGAGGSVFLTVGTLKGAGIIEANGSPQGRAGSGGRISIVEKIATEPQFTGRVDCLGYATSKDTVGANGTIYRQNASDEPGRGTLLVQSQAYADANHQTELTASTMPDVNEPFGAVIVEKNAGLRIFAGTTCTVTRAFSIATAQGATFTADVGSCLKFIDAGCDACVTGALMLAGLECTEPGKRIVFTPGTAGKTSFKDGGKLTIRGTEENPVWLCGADNSEWLLNLQAGSKTDILHASVTNSNARSGGSVLAISSNDLGGNDNWSFEEPIQPGAVIEWTGAEDSDWTKAGNWSPARQPNETDDVRITDPAAINFPVISNKAVVFNRLTLAEGMTLTLKGETVDDTNELTVAGTLVFTGRQKLSLSASAVSFADGAVVPAESTVCILDGVETFNPNNCTFCRLEISRFDGSLALTDGLKARFFTVRATDDATLTFAAGKTVEAETVICSCSAAADEKYLTLQSSASGSPWYVKSPRTSYMTGVKVSDSTAIGAVAVASLSVNNGRNANWIFDNGVSEWVGGASGKFDVAANWYPAGVPGATNDVILRGAAAITADGDVSVRSLTLLPDEVKGSLLVNGVLTTAGDVVVGTNATLTLDSKKDGTNCFNVIGGDLIVEAGGAVTHEGLESSVKTLAAAVNGPKLWIRATNVDVRHGGQITAVGKGYAAGSGGPAAGGNHVAADGTTYTCGAGHAGIFNHAIYNSAVTNAYLSLTDYRAYGSMFEPETYGSSYVGSGNATSGGGVIRLEVTENLTVNGVVSANGTDWFNYGYTGAGGSIWITCKGLFRGSGVVSAGGGKLSNDYPGGGGRIAVYAASDFVTSKTFTGRISTVGQITGGTGGRGMTTAPGTIVVKLDGENTYSLLVDYDEYDSLSSGQKTEFQSNSSLVQNATPIPTEEDLDKLDLFKRTSVMCGRISVLNLTRDLKIYDLNFTASAASKARLNLHTLKLLSSSHKKGKGWAVKNAGDDPIATHIWPCEKDGAKGKIVWSGGMALIVK